MRSASVALLMACLLVAAAAGVAESAAEEAAAGAASAPDGASAARPRLGLVLSGGGARGAAHIGVLEVLEELRIPVDLVTGTSMGSVVGGLYAAGLSPEELSAAIQGTDWVRVFDDRPGRQELSFRRKQDDRTFLTNLRVGLRDWTFFVPSGLVEGQKLDFLLRSLTLRPDGLAQIEELPLPFRAVATDIATGEAVVLDRGPLAVAQRASMSIPAAFSPVTGDRLLVDGFVANNLPIDVAQELGAEAVIAVDVATPLSTLEELETAVAISGQVSTLAVQESQRRQIERLGPEDVLLQPALGDIGAASFPRMEEAIEAGRQAAWAAREQLARHAVPEAEYAAWRARQRRPPQPLPVVDEIRLENRSLLSDRVVRARIGAREGEPLDLEQVSVDLGRLFGMDAFERVRFDLRREQGRTILVYELDARARGTNYFRVGLNLETDIGNEATYNLGLNHVLFPLNRWGGEIRNEAQFGDTNRLESQLYQPLEPHDWLYALPLAYYERRDIDVFSDGDRVARYVLEETLVGFQLGVNLGRFAQLRGGIGYLDLEARRRIGDPAVFRNDSLHGGVYQSVLEVDTLDDTRFPNRGSYVRASTTFLREELGFDDSFELIDVEASTYLTWRRNTLGIGAEYGTALDADDRIVALRSLGGFLNLSGFERDSIVGPHAGLVRLIGYRRIASPALFAWEFPVYAGGVLEAGNAWESRGDLEEEVLLSGGPLFGVDTPLGPLYLAYAYGEGGEHQGYLYLGQTF